MRINERKQYHVPIPRNNTAYRYLLTGGKCLKASFTSRYKQKQN